MWFNSSNESASGSGTLHGAYAPPLPGISYPTPLDPAEKKYLITCPQDKKGGDTMIVSVKGQERNIIIPKQVNSTLEEYAGTKRAIRPGDKFHWTDEDWKRVIASTLPTLPGATIIEAKPMIWASASEAFSKRNQISMGTAVGPMLQRTQQELLKRTVQVGCNAVLGVK